MTEDTSAKRANRRRRTTRAGRRSAMRMPAGVAGEGWTPGQWPPTVGGEPRSAEEGAELLDAELDEAADESAEGECSAVELEADAVAEDEDDARKTEEIQITPLMLKTPLPPVLEDERTQPRIRVDGLLSGEDESAPPRRDLDVDALTNPQIKVGGLLDAEGEADVVAPPSSVVIAPSRIISDTPRSSYGEAPLEAPSQLPVGVLVAEGSVVAPGAVQAAETDLDEGSLQLVDVEDADVDASRSSPRTPPPPPTAARVDPAAPPSAGRPDASSLPASQRADAGGATARAKPPPPVAARAEGLPKRPPPPPNPNKVEEDRQKRKQARQWWERFFSDDYLMTVLPPLPGQIAKQVDFVEQSLGLNKGATLLDVGCGLGVYANELTKRGYLVVGLDLSLAMITRAAEEAQQQGLKINFVHADIREMEFDGAFDAVICMGTTFGFFDEEANRDVLARLHQALRPGGRLLLDVVNRDYVVGLQPNLVWFEGDECVCMEESDFNYFTSRLSVKRTLMREDGRQSNAEYSLRLYSLHELGQLMQQSGFRVIEVSGQEAIRGAFFGSHSPRVLMLAERRTPGRPSATVSSDRASVELSRSALGTGPERGSGEMQKPPKPE